MSVDEVSVYEMPEEGLTYVPSIDRLTFQRSENVSCWTDSEVGHWTYWDQVPIQPILHLFVRFSHKYVYFLLILPFYKYYTKYRLRMMAIELVLLENIGR
jgi:hypothetical protein